MAVFTARNLQPKSAFHFLLRQGHTGPSRLRLKRKDQNEDKSCNYNPYIFHPRVRTIEPVRQALRNTKSIMNEGLPTVVLSGMDDLPFETILPQIKHSVVSSMICEDHHVKYVQRSKGIIMNVIKAVWSCADRYPGLSRQTISYKPYLKVSWNRFGYNFQVSGRTGLLFSSELLLPNFASSLEIKKTTETSVEEKDELISPIFELSQNVSGTAFDGGFYCDMFPFPQTLVVTERNWKLPHLIAQGMMFSFGRLAECAVCKNGESFGDVLQNPMSIRSIVFNDQKMVLLCYQLNTLDFDNDEGVKNQLWLSPEFSFLGGDEGHSKNLQNGNMEFPDNEFKQLVALLLYGEGEEALQQSSLVM